VLFLLTIPPVRAVDEPVYDASIEGTVEMIDYVRGTISIVPLRPIGETFRVSPDCKVILSRKESAFNRLEPGHKVSLAYDRYNSVVGRIVAIPGNQQRIMRPKETETEVTTDVATLKPANHADTTSTMQSSAFVPRRSVRLSVAISGR
jgi:hypothetical protein